MKAVRPRPNNLLGVWAELIRSKSPSGLDIIQFANVLIIARRVIFLVFDRDERSTLLRVPPDSHEHDDRDY